MRFTCLHGENDEWRCYHPVGVSDIQVEYAGDTAIASVAGSWPIAQIVRKIAADRVSGTHGPNWTARWRPAPTLPLCVGCSSFKTYK
jgi:hypothetical protein